MDIETRNYFERMILNQTAIMMNQTAILTALQTMTYDEDLKRVLRHSFEETIDVMKNYNEI